MKTHFSRQLTGSFVLANISPCVRDKEKTTIDLYLEPFSKEILPGELNAQHCCMDPTSGSGCCQSSQDSTAKSEICCYSKAHPAQILGAPKMGPAEAETLNWEHSECLWGAEPTQAVRRHMDIPVNPCLNHKVWPCWPHSTGTEAVGQWGEKNLVSLKAQNNFWKVGCLFLSSTTQTILH